MHDDEAIDVGYKTSAVAVIERPNTLPTLDLTAPGAIEAAVAKMEAMLEFKERILMVCIKRAKPTDIMGMGHGRDEMPYFSEAFCEQIASRLSDHAEIRLVSKELEHYDDGHYGYLAHYRIHIPGLGTTDGIGLATTKDQFLGVKTAKVWNNQTRKKEAKLDSAGNPITQAPSEVSRHNLLQHARTRAVGSALRKLLGLTSLTWEDLESMGFSREGSTRVAYDGKKAAASDAPPALVAKLKGFVTSKTFTWPQVSSISQELSLKGRALQMNKEDMTKLVAELTKRAAELERGE